MTEAWATHSQKFLAGILGDLCKYLHTLRHPRIRHVAIPAAAATVPARKAEPAFAPAYNPAS
jgi:hypothetical protein